MSDALTREQVEKIFGSMRDSPDEWDRKRYQILVDQFAALRQQLDAMTQERDAAIKSLDDTLYRDSSTGELRTKWVALGMAGLKADLAKMTQERDALKERLEMGFAYDPQGHRVELPGDTGPDGIECRDETIRLQDKRVDELETQLAAMTQERDAAQQRYEKKCEGTFSRIREKVLLTRQLAEAQAELKRLRTEKGYTESEVHAAVESRTVLYRNAMMSIRAAVKTSLCSHCDEVGMIAGNALGVKSATQAAMDRAQCVLHATKEASMQKEHEALMAIVHWANRVGQRGQLVRNAAIFPPATATDSYSIMLEAYDPSSAATEAS